MNEQERQIIADIFRRLEQAADQPRDPEAESFIAEQIRRQPHAPYAMAQTVYVQEQAIANLHNQVQQLQAELQRLQHQSQPSGGFLSSIFGGARPPEPPRPGPGHLPTGTPWGRPAPQGSMQTGFPVGQPGTGRQAGPWGMQPRAGGGFLQGALATAAGVAGGMMIANALSSAFGGNEEAASGSADQANALTGSEASQSADAGSHQEASEPLYRDAGYEQDLGGEGGDDGDWA